jgi:hypothetical protein
MGVEHISFDTVVKGTDREANPLTDDPGSTNLSREVTP